MPDHATGQGVQQDNAGFGRLQTKATSSPSFYQYANGKGTPQDYRDAMVWFQTAADQGHPVARLYLVMYAEGRGVPQDYVRAHMWFSLSVAQGSKERSRL